MGKNKTKDPSAILERAENLFVKGSWLAAKREFEKAAKLLGSGEISGKMAVCDSEIAKQKAKDLIKKGRKCLEKNDSGQALAWFEKAHNATGEAWIGEKIDQLRKQLHGRDALDNAVELEGACQFEKAAELYGQAWELEGRDELLFKKAHCLVRAEKYDDAIAIFEKCASENRTVTYDHGFALAKTGKFGECLKVWSLIRDTDEVFDAQADSVRHMLAADLFARFNAGGDAGEIFEEGLLLRGTAVWESVRDLVEYAKFAQIEALCEKEQFEAALGLLIPYPDNMGAGLLALCAKLHYRLAETGQCLREFIMFWLTALYHPEVFENLSSNANEREAARAKLLEDAKELIRLHGNADRSEKALVDWKLQEKAVRNVCVIAGNHRENAWLVMAPKYAEKFGKSNPVLRMIMNNKDAFDDPKEWFETGGMYSCAGKSLFQLEYGEYEAAAESLPASGEILEEEADFAAYCIEKTIFANECHRMENGGKPDKRFYDAAASLFDKIPDLEKEFIDKAIDAEEIDALEAFETALGQILARHPTDRIKNAFSLIMTRRAIRASNTGRLNRKGLVKSLEKALRLNPENDLALLTEKAVRKKIEREELDKALWGHKMGKACQMAASSENEELRDDFFIFIATMFDILAESGMDTAQKQIRMEDLVQWSIEVDPYHPIIEMISDHIDSMEKSNKPAQR